MSGKTTTARSPRFLLVGMVVAVLHWGPSPASAEMSGDDYASIKRLATPDEQRRVASELERAQQRTAALEADRAWQEAQRRARAAEVQALRPLGDRLLDSRCTACHGLNVLDQRARSALGWRWTVERMRWWHGAVLRPEEVAAVASHLSRTRPGPAGWLEAVLAMAAGLLIGIVYRLWPGSRSGRYREKASI